MLTILHGYRVASPADLPGVHLVGIWLVAQCVFLQCPNKSIAAFTGSVGKIVSPKTQSDSFKKVAVGTITANQMSLRSAECSVY